MPIGLGGEKIWLCPTLGGNNLDLSGNANYGTYAGGMGVVVDKYKGKQAYGLDGIDDYIDLGNAVNPVASFSISFWARTSVTAQQMFVSKNFSASREPYIVRRDSGGGVLRFYTYQGSLYGTSVANPFTINEWASVVCVFNGISHAIYFNGEKVAETVTNQPAFNNSASLYIGDTTVTGWNVSGAMDDVRFFNRALSSQECAYLALQRGIEGSPLNPLITLKSRVSKTILSRAEEPAFNNWYARPGRTNRIVGSGVHV